MKLSANDFLKIGSRIIVPEFQKEFLLDCGSFGFYELHADLKENIVIEPKSYKKVKLKEQVHIQEKFQNKLIGVASGLEFQDIFKRDINIYPAKPVISYELGALTHVVIVNNTDKRFILKSSAVVGTLKLISLGDDIEWLDKLNEEEHDGVFCPRFSLKDLLNNLQTLDDLDNDFHIDDAFKKSLIKENKKTYESKVDMKGMGECKEMYVPASYILEDKNCLDSFITGVIQLIHSSREYRDFLYHYNFLKIHLFPISIQDEIRNRLHIIELNEGFTSRFSIAKSIIRDLYDEYQLYREYRSIMEKENQTVDAITKDCGINSFTTTDLGLYFFSPTEIPGKKDKEFINSCAKRIRGILDGSIRYDNEDFYQFMSSHEGMVIELFPITIEQEILIELRLMWYDNCTLTSERDLVRSIIDKIVNKKLSYLIFDKDDKDIYDGILEAFTDSIQNIEEEIEDYDPFIYWIYVHLKICSKSRYMNLSSYMFQANELPHASEIFKIETVANEIFPYKRTNFRKYDSLPWNFTEHSVFKNTEFDNPSVGSYIKLFPFSVQAIAFIIRYRSRKDDIDDSELFSMIVDLVRDGKIGYIDLRCGNVKKYLNQNLLVRYNRSFFDKLLLTAIEDNPITDEDFSELEQMYHPSVYDDDLLLNRISSYEFIDINIMNHNNFELYKKFKAWLLRKKK